MLPKALLLLPLFLTATAAAQGAAFDPRVHGFAFTNDFQNDAVPWLDLRTGGLCGGMVYAALDYCLAGQPAPPQDYRPANGTPLHAYLYQRQIDSLASASAVSDWADLLDSEDGQRDAELFRRCVGDGAHLAALRGELARGRPVPLGVRGVGGPRTGMHQILALSLRGGGEGVPLTISVYDPNWPGETQAMVADASAQCFVYQAHPRRHWVAYIVDRHYAPATPTVAAAPPTPDDGAVHALVLALRSGARGLAGGRRNVDVRVLLQDAPPREFSAVNGGARWLSDYAEFVRLPLEPPVPAAQVRGIEIAAPRAAGWQLREVRAFAGAGERLGAELGHWRGEPLRFDAEHAQVVLRGEGGAWAPTSAR